MRAEVVIQNSSTSYRTPHTIIGVAVAVAVAVAAAVVGVIEEDAALAAAGAVVVEMAPSAVKAVRVH